MLIPRDLPPSIRHGGRFGRTNERTSSRAPVVTQRHGRAGDSAARLLSQAAMTAGDVIDELATVMSSLSER